MSNEFDYSVYDEMLYKRIENIIDLNKDFYIKSKINL